jgi:hypothetical protein
MSATSPSSRCGCREADIGRCRGGPHEGDQSFVESKLTPHPTGTYLQPIKLSGAREKIAKKTYIRVPKFPQPAFDKAIAACKVDKSWATFELSDAGHIAMLDAPDRVTQLILQAA